MICDLKVNVLLPCRAGSQRIIKKNTRPFAGIKGGLLELKLRQLCESKFVDEIVVSSDDDEVLEFASGFGKNNPGKIFTCIPRPPEFAVAAPLDDFVEYVATIMPQGLVFWTHVTSPFFDGRCVDNLLRAYSDKVVNGIFDSMMTVLKEQTFMWDHNGVCISHDRNKVSWPQTQDLPPVYLVNSAAFVVDRVVMLENSDRVGKCPYMYTVNKIEGFDIDWPEDFDMAERLFVVKHEKS